MSEIIENSLDVIGGSTDLAIDDHLSKDAALLKETLHDLKIPQITLTQMGNIRMPDETQTDSLRCVVLGFTNYNAYYTKAYDPDNVVPPTCWAINDHVESMAPTIPNPQAPTCRECWANEYDSAPNGRGGKACKNYVRMALMLPDLTLGDDIYLFRASPTAARDAKKQVLAAISLYQHPVRVVMEMTVDTRKNYPRAVFNIVEMNEQYKYHARYIDIAKALLMTEPNTMDTEVAAVAPQVTAGSAEDEAATASRRKKS